MATKNQKLRWRAYLAVMAAFVVIIIGDACRKIDYNRDKKIGIIVDRTEKFFSVPANTDSRVKAIADRIKRQNDTFHFVDDLSERIGFPVWNKTLIASNSMQSRSNTDSSGITILYIPFDNDSVIVATLIVRTDENDTACQVLNDFDYSRYSFDSATTSSTWNAKDVFTLFSALEKSVFDRTDFVITDKRLFPGDTSKVCVVHVKDPPPGQRAEVLSNTTLCEWIDVCFGPDWYEDWCGGGCTTGCEFYTQTEMGCTIVWYESGGGAPSGGGSTWWPPACGTGGVNCGTTGWAPLPYSPLTDYATQGYHHFEHLAYIKADKDAINDWKEENLDTTGLDPCIRKVLDKLLDTSNLIGKMLIKMDRAMFRTPKIKNLSLVIRVMSFPADSTNGGWTTGGTYNPVTQSVLDTIKIKPSIAAGASELGIAALLMHEIVHAYMKLAFNIYWYSSFSQSQINNWKVDTLFNIFIDSMKLYNTQQGVQNWLSGNPSRDHNFMADKMLSFFASALEKIDNNPALTDRYYWYLGWGGLMRTKTMKQFFPNLDAAPPGDWPPSNPAPNDDSTYGLKYALTTDRIDSILKACYREEVDTAHAVGRKRTSPPGCYQSNLPF